MYSNEKLIIPSTFSLMTKKAMSPVGALKGCFRYFKFTLMKRSDGFSIVSQSKRKAYGKRKEACCHGKKYTVTELLNHELFLGATFTKLSLTNQWFFVLVNYPLSEFVFCMLTHPRVFLWLDLTSGIWYPFSLKQNTIQWF